MIDLNSVFFEGIQKEVTNVDVNKFKEIVNYNVGNGKNLRFRIFKELLNVLCPKHNKELLKFGYAIELLQAGFLIIDDIMDNSSLRRGKEYHYRKRGLLAVRDGQFLISLAGQLLNSIDGFIGADTIFITSLGQSLDTMQKTIEDYTFELYRTIVESKTSFYTFYLPLYGGYKCLNRQVSPNLLEFTKLAGYVFQVYDDYLNFVPDKSMKTGNDLEEGKLTYFTALLGESSLRQEFEKYFNHKEVDDKLLMFVDQNLSKCKDEIDQTFAQMRRLISQDNKELLFVLTLLENHVTWS